MIAQMGHNAKNGARRQEAPQFFTNALRFCSSHYKENTSGFFFVSSEKC